MELAYDFSDAQLETMGYVAWRQVDSVWLGVAPMTFGKGRLCFDLNPGGYDDGWCYASLSGAIAAMLQWDLAVAAEPDGWFRHPFTGRRRPNGDAAQEYVSA